MYLPQRLIILSAGGKVMRNIIAGFAVVGLLAVGVGAPATAYTMSAPMAVMQPNAVHQADWDNCGPRCRDRQEARERELERERRAEHRRWEEHHRWEEGNRYPSSYGYQQR
jgi:Ni/Co efflux regulator RcnB